MSFAGRYINETKRLFQVYEDRLANGRDYLVGPDAGKFTYADAVTFPWIRAHPCEPSFAYCSYTAQPADARGPSFFSQTRSGSPRLPRRASLTWTRTSSGARPGRRWPRRSMGT